MNIVFNDERCCNCGATLPAKEIVETLSDAGFTLSDLFGMTDEIGFCCSSYTDEHGCHGNDENDIAYWFTR